MSSLMKKVFVFLLILILIGVAVTAYFYYLNPRQTTDSDNQNNSSQNAGGFSSKQEVEPTKNPEKFPTDVPIESGARITQNYNASTTDGRFQATKEFQTNKTLAENLTIYRSYLESNGWEIRSTVDQENYKMIFGVKGNADLQVSMDYNSEQDMRKVTIFYTESVAK